MAKRNTYLPVLVLALCLLGAVAAAVGMQLARKEPISYVQFRETKQGMTLTPVYDAGEDTWYLYLPSHAGEEDLRITASPGVKATLEDNILHVKTPLGSRAYPVEILQCTNLPTLSLEAEDGILDYIHEDLRHEKDVRVTMTDAAGETVFQQMATLSGRGNATWFGDKRPYNLRFSQNVPAGPFQGIETLCLMAERFDESKLRNSLAYFAGRNLGIDYSSEYLYCSLYVNGEYRGLYGITTKQAYTRHLETDGIRGVFEYTGFAKPNQFYSFPGLKPIRVLYGDMEQIQYAVNDFCDALYAKDWQRCETLIDMESFAQKYAMDQFFLNRDMCYASQYFYIDADNVIHTMLPWDYDRSMGACREYYRIPAPSNILMNDPPDYWGSLLLENPAFCEKIVDVLERDYTDEFFHSLTVHLEETIDQIQDCFDNDVIRWGGPPEATLFYDLPDREHLQVLKESFSAFYPRRREFLLNHFGSYGGASAEADLSVPVGDETILMYNQPPATQLEEVPEAAEGIPWGKLAIVGALAAAGVLLVLAEILHNHVGPRKKDGVAV